MTVAGFRHRKLSDGTWNSICLRCYGTVDNVFAEEELAESELKHECVYLPASVKTESSPEQGTDTRQL
jgi:hypothetical protein